MMRSRGFGILVFSTVLAFGCGGGEAEAPEPEPVNVLPFSRPSLSELDGTAWGLRALEQGYLAPAEPEVTLAFDGTQIAGSSGCNRYFGEMTETAPGSVTVGPVGGTRMACEETAMDLETAYLTRLDKVVGVEIRSGLLALVWEDEGRLEALIFSKVTPPAGPEPG